MRHFPKILHQDLNYLFLDTIRPMFYINAKPAFLFERNQIEYQTALSDIVLYKNLLNPEETNSIRQAHVHAFSYTQL